MSMTHTIVDFVFCVVLQLVFHLFIGYFEDVSEKVQAFF